MYPLSLTFVLFWFILLIIKLSSYMLHKLPKPYEFSYRYKHSSSLYLYQLIRYREYCHPLVTVLYFFIDPLRHPLLNRYNYLIMDMEIFNWSLNCVHYVLKYHRIYYCHWFFLFLYCDKLDVESRSKGMFRDSSAFPSWGYLSVSLIGIPQ